MQSEKTLTKAEREHLTAVLDQQLKTATGIIATLVADTKKPERRRVRKGVAA